MPPDVSLKLLRLLVLASKTFVKALRAAESPKGRAVYL